MILPGIAWVLQSTALTTTLCAVVTAGRAHLAPAHLPLGEIETTAPSGVGKTYWPPRDGLWRPDA